mmetsp:Transcript_52930/g.139420  ORF Transcript_52930/g.139420 Transcript_52930/m.139420 type:complete len:90 (+) Transcript_52930:37-306(+)
MPTNLDFCVFLQVVGEPILERRGQLEVLLIPIRVNVNLKAVTVEDLMQRRKYLHLGMVKNLRCYFSAILNDSSRLCTVTVCLWSVGKSL